MPLTDILRAYRLNVLDSKFMSVSVLLNISVQVAPFFPLLNHRVVLELDVPYPLMFAGDIQTLVKVQYSIFPIFFTNINQQYTEIATFQI